MLQSTVPSRWSNDEIPSRGDMANALRCPFPLRINRHVNAAHEPSLRWVRRLFGDELLAQKAAKARMAWMVAGF